MPARRSALVVAGCLLPVAGCWWLVLPGFACVWLLLVLPCYVLRNLGRELFRPGMSLIISSCFWLSGVWARLSRLAALPWLLLAVCCLLLAVAGWSCLVSLVSVKMSYELLARN